MFFQIGAYDNGKKATKRWQETIPKPRKPYTGRINKDRQGRDPAKHEEQTKRQGHPEAEKTQRRGTQQKNGKGKPKGQENQISDRGSVKGRCIEPPDVNDPHEQPRANNLLLDGGPTQRNPPPPRHIRNPNPQRLHGGGRRAGLDNGPGKRLETKRGREPHPKKKKDRTKNQKNTKQPKKKKKNKKK
ncbi:MAG: hypothetical protein U5J96_14055 [Ignavibacteriaceae bacterium]|nr:hypothetical protein [Ignavibacteriaceae bacterium]